MNKKISLGLSPCPNDTFIFHALLHNLVKPQYEADIEFDITMADVEKLNAGVLANGINISKISLGVAPYIMNNYMLLSSGSALGWGCGPLVISRKVLTDRELERATIAIPGKMTTANLLLDLHGKFKGPKKEMVFNEIMPAVINGDADIGVIIHEGRFTYQNFNLHKALDLGQWWEENFHLPLPLGAIAIQRDLPFKLIESIEKAIVASLSYARANPAASREFIRANAQELNEKVTQAHIDAFVTDYSLDLGEKGRAAIQTLMAAAAKINKNIAYFSDKRIFFDWKKL